MIVEPGAVIGGKYKLERQLAAGGMGSVWVAKHLQLQTDVAVKLLDAAAAGSADAHARFEREAKALSKLRHPNIVQVHDFGLEDDMPYLVMELLRGESLEERLRREKRLPVKVVSTMLAQVAKGLRRAHEAGFVHRDLKPGNLFIAKTDDEEKLTVLDFGIAKQTGVVIDNSTKTGEFMGSPHYMSPEQIRDSKDIDARSDLWSLAVILFRALTGSLPFPGSTLGAVLADVVSAPIPKISEAAPDLPVELDTFFDKAFSRDRTKRFGSAREMAEAFAAVLRAKESPAAAAPRPADGSQGEAAAPPGPPRPANSTNLPSNAAVGKGGAPVAPPRASPASSAPVAPPRATPASSAPVAPPRATPASSGPVAPPHAPPPSGVPVASPHAPPPSGVPVASPHAPPPSGVPVASPHAPPPSGAPVASPHAPPPSGTPVAPRATPARATSGPSGTALYSREALRLPPAPGPPSDPAPVAPSPAAAWDDASRRGPAPVAPPPAAAWDDPSRRGPAPAPIAAPPAAAWDDPSRRGPAPAPIAPPPAAAWDDPSRRGAAPIAAPPAAAWDDPSMRGPAPAPTPAPAAATWDDPSMRGPAPAPPAAAWDDPSKRGYAPGAPPRAPAWEDTSQRGPPPAPPAAAWDDRSQRAYPTGSYPRSGWDDPSQRAPAPAGAWDDRSQRGYPMGAPASSGPHHVPPPAPSQPGATPPSNAGAAPSHPAPWEEVSQRHFPGLAGQTPIASPIPAPSHAIPAVDPTLSSAHGTAPPHGTPIPEPRPSTQGFDPMRGPGASTPVLGGTLTVSPSARDSSPQRPQSAGDKPSGAPQIAAPLAAKAGAAAFGAILTVIILVFALRSKPPVEAEVTPGTAETAPVVLSSPPAEPPPPASTSTPVEGVIEMAEGEVAEAIAAEPELLEQMDAGADAAGPRIPPIPWGKARLIVVSKSGPCKVTINGISQGTTPVHIFVNPGKAKVYCRLKTGSTRSRELDVPRMRTSFVIFDNPSLESPKPK